MEKIFNKENKLIIALTNSKVKYIVGTTILSLIGIALPRIFHILAGSNAGAVFLPMHIAVLVAALTFGVVSATFVSGSSIVFSYLLTGMPSLVRLPYMLIELIIYSVLLGMLNKKYSSYLSLIITIILGRVIYAGIMYIATNILGMQAYGISIIESVKVGLPGIAIQILLIPHISKFLNEGLNIKND